LNENKTTENIKISFSPEFGTSVGRKEAQLIFGFQSKNLERVLLRDTFLLIGKFSNKYIDFYDDYVSFDSVFINQKQPVNLK